jgi:hypothetical protein
VVDVLHAGVAVQREHSEGEGALVGAREVARDVEQILRDGGAAAIAPQEAPDGVHLAESSASAAAAPGTSPEPQQIGPDDFHFVQIVGRGSYGVVWEAMKVDTRKTYAIKVLEKVLRMTPRVHDVSSRLVVGPQNPRR